MKIETITRNCKRRLIKNLCLKTLLLLVCVALLILSAVYSRYFWFYLIGVCLLAAAIALCRLTDRRVCTAYTFRPIRGRVIKTFIDVRRVDEFLLSGVGLWARRFDHDRRDIRKTDLFIEEEGNRIVAIRFEDVGERHSAYYRDSDEVVRAAGMRFPLVLGRETEEFLCPVCGEFHPAAAERCGRCHIRFS